MAGNQNSGRPGGNPDITKTKRTGPTSEEGKLRVVTAALRHGNHSKMIKQYRRNGCNKCPMRERVFTFVVGNTEKKRTQPSICPNFEKDKKKCDLDIGEMVGRLKAYDELSGINTLELQKKMILDAAVDASMAREHEILEKGRPGTFGKEYAELSLKYLNELNKLQYGELHKNVNVNVDISSAIVDAYKKRKTSQ